MSTRIVQTCERVRRVPRTHAENTDPRTGGWRRLNSGSLEATFCNVCVRTIVTAAIESAENRARENQP